MTACSSAAPQHALQTVRDSAGITIVEDRDTSWATTRPWRVDASPMLSIGVVEGPAEYRFSGIAGVVRLGDGRIAVADYGSRQIRFYGASGKFLRAVGRQGEGPGEFRIMNFVRRFRGDSLITGDFALRRLTVLSQNGDVGRVVPGPAYQTFYFWADAEPFVDGALLGDVSPRIAFKTLRHGPLDVLSVYFRFDPASGSVDTLARLFDVEDFVGVQDGHEMVTTPTFSPHAVTAVAGSRWYYGSSRRFEIRTYTEGGKLMRILRLDRANPPVTDSLLQADLDRILSRVTNENARRRLRAERAAVPSPKTLPAYGALRVDADTDLWVAKYPLFGESPSRWTVFDPSGHLLGDVAMPPRFDVYDIGSDYVLGVKRDSLDVEHVAMYRLSK